MILKAFSVYDDAAQAYGQPFFAPALGLAIRMFTDLVNDPKSSPSQYPDQFTLFELGDFDDATGVLERLPTPRSMGKAIEFKKTV